MMDGKRARAYQSPGTKTSGVKFGVLLFDPSSNDFFPLFVNPVEKEKETKNSYH